MSDSPSSEAHHFDDNPAPFWPALSDDPAGRSVRTPGRLPLTPVELAHEWRHRVAGGGAGRSAPCGDGPLESPMFAPVDWPADAAVALIERVCAGVDPLPALRRFAAQRQGVGVDLREIAGEIDKLISVLPPSRRPMIDRFATFSCVLDVARLPPWNTDLAAVDGLTGLGNAGYLHLRLLELQQQCQALGARIENLYLLLIAEFTADRRPGFTRLGAQIDVAVALGRRFNSGEPTVTTRPGTFVVVCSSSDDLGSLLPLLTKELTNRCGGVPVRVWVESLAGDAVSRRGQIDALSM